MINRNHRKLIGYRKRILLVATAIGISAIPAVFGNLLDDGSFDHYTNDRFDFWTIGPKPDPEGVTSIGTVSQDLDGGYPVGGNAVKFTFFGYGTYTVVAKGLLPLDPARKYRLTVHVKSTGEPIRVRTEIRPRATGQRERTRTIHHNFNSHVEWKKETVEWQPAENEPEVELVFYLENPVQEAATIWLDEIAIDTIDG